MLQLKEFSSELLPQLIAFARLMRRKNLEHSSHELDFWFSSLILKVTNSEKKVGMILRYILKKMFGFSGLIRPSLKNISIDKHKDIESD